MVIHQCLIRLAIQLSGVLCVTVPYEIRMPAKLSKNAYKNARIIRHSVFSRLIHLKSRLVTHIHMYTFLIHT